MTSPDRPSDAAPLVSEAMVEAGARALRYEEVRIDKMLNRPIGKVEFDECDAHTQISYLSTARLVLTAALSASPPRSEPRVRSGMVDVAQVDALLDAMHAESLTDARRLVTEIWLDAHTERALPENVREAARQVGMYVEACESDSLPDQVRSEYHIPGGGFTSMAQDAGKHYYGILRLADLRTLLAALPPRDGREQDGARLDFLEAHTEGRRWQFRESFTERGWRLLTTTREPNYATVREAIDAARVAAQNKENG